MLKFSEPFAQFALVLFECPVLCAPGLHVFAERGEAHELDVVREGASKVFVEVMDSVFALAHVGLVRRFDEGPVQASLLDLGHQWAEFCGSVYDFFELRHELVDLELWLVPRVCSWFPR